MCYYSMAKPDRIHRLTAQIHQDINEWIIHPSYSPDLAPSRLKKRGKHFRSDDEGKTAVHEWLQSRPKEFFSRDIHALPKWWNTCITRQRVCLKEYL